MDGERVIVKNAVPGQKVRFVINKKRKGKCEGRLLEVVEHSPISSRIGPVPMAASAAAACIRGFPMRSS